MASALLIYLVVLWQLGKGNTTFVFDPICILFAGFLILATLSLIDTVDKTRGLLFVGQYIPYMLVAIFIISVINSRGRLDRIIGAIINIGLVFCFVVIIAGVLLRDRDNLHFFLLNTFNISANKILTYVAMPLCIVVTRVMRGRVKIYDVFALFVYILSIWISGSRGGVVVSGTIILLAILTGRNVKKPMLLLVICSVAISFVMKSDMFGYVSRRVEKFHPRTEEGYINVSFSRYYTALTALQVLKEHPVNGVGMGNLGCFLEEASEEIAIPEEIIQYWTRNNIFQTTCTPFKLGAEMGIGGLFFFFMFYYYLWRRLRIRENEGDEKAQVSVAGMRLFVVSSFLHNFVDLGYTNYYTWIYYGIVVAGSRVYRS